MMRKKLLSKLLLVLTLLFMGSMSAFAQGGDVTGKVTDASDGLPLPGVTVLIKGSTTGTISDVDGNYRITVEPNTTLVFSFIGYENQEILVQPNTTVNVALEFSSTVLDELVVIGYGVQKKEDATGSVAAVSTKEFNRGAMNTPTELLSGKIAGVQITTNGGAPGQGTTIRIRGGSSLSADNDPLIVIDGVPVDNEDISGTRDPLSTINPNDIETFTVLKDASATAIYGSRASNGVILITTKKGALAKAGQGKKFINVEYNGTFSFYTIPKTISVLEADEYRSIMNDRYAGNNNVLSLVGTKSTDWQSEIYKNAFGMDHYLSASGAIGMLPYRLSAGYSGQDGILKTDNMKRTTIAASLNPTLLDGHLKIDFNVKGMFIKNHFADQGAIGAAIQYDPTKPVTSDSVYTVYFNNLSGEADSLTTDYGGYYAWTQPNGAPVSQGSSNPVALLELRDDNSDVNRLIGNVQLDYKLHFLPDLRANLNLGLDRTWSDGTVFVPDYAPWEFDAVNGGGLSTIYDQEKKNELLDFYLNYVKDVASINSTFNVMAGYSWQHFWRRGSNYSTNLIETVVNDSSDYETESYLVSFFGRFNYAFKNRYLLTFTLRNDGTSRFSPDTRWGLFPSVALAWKINDEAFLRDSKTISQLKLRLGWGITGQQNIGQGDYPYLPRYTYSQPNASYMFGQQFLLTLRPEGYDANIKWEETTTWNIGLDYGFSRDRFYGSLDFYYRETADLINFIPVPAGSNLTNYILTNIGDLKNQGLEFSIFTRPVVNNDWNWELGFNATYNQNEITKLTASADTNYLGVLVGGISGGVGNTVQIHSVGYPANSFFVYEQVYDADGNPIEGMYVDRNGDGEITDDDRYHYKDPAAKFYFGITSNLQYRNWTFSFAGRANFGNYVYDNVNSENAVWQRLYRPEGPYTGNVVSEVKTIDFVTPQYLSDYFIKDASFFRMDNITLSYLFDKLASGKVNLLVSATVNNAFVISQYKGIDPEIQNGIDNRIYPRPRVFVLGLNLQF
jgi:iron complex outermembrane receptor protein